MNKKEAILVSVMGIVTAAVILTGFNYSRDRQQELSQGDQYSTQSQSEAFKERQLQEQEEDKARFLGVFEKNRDKATVADFLQYVDYNKKAVNVVYYGAITENAAWADAGLSQVAQGRDLSKVSRHYVSLAEGAAFTDEAEIAKVAGHKPDVVFLALPQVADQTDLSEAELEFFQAYDRIKTEVPDALIVLLSPAPAAEETVAEGNTVSYLQAYVAHMKAASEEKKVGFYDLHTPVREGILALGGELKNLYDEQKALNQDGNRLLQEAFIQNLQETVVDTSTAFQAKDKKKPVESLVPEDTSSEEASLEAAASEQASLEAAASEQASLEAAASEEASLEAALSEEASLEAAASEQASLEAAASEQASLEAAASEQAAREKAASEQAARAKAASEQAAREKAASEEAARAKAASEQAARAKAASEQAAREKAASEKAAREKAASEEAARAKAASEQAAREKAAKEQESRNQESKAQESSRQSNAGSNSQ